MANVNLSAARSAKRDEFYTQWADIEREMNAYLEYDPDVFRGKTVLLPCDDPEWSNFTKYFVLHFTNLGIKKLISTSYEPQSNKGGKYYEPTLFETEDLKYNADQSEVKGGYHIANHSEIHPRVRQQSYRRELPRIRAVMDGSAEQCRWGIYHHRLLKERSQ